MQIPALIGLFLVVVYYILKIISLFRKKPLPKDEIYETNPAKYVRTLLMSVVSDGLFSFVLEIRVIVLDSISEMEIFI